MADDADRALKDQAIFDKIRLDAHRKEFNTPSGLVDCVDCDEPIGSARLENLPSAKRCIDCQSIFEMKR